MSIQTENVPPLTYRIGDLLDEAVVAYLLRLLDGEATARQLRDPTDDVKDGNPYLRRQLDQAAGSRLLVRLRDLGLVDAGAKANTYRLTLDQDVRASVEALNRLALAVGPTPGDTEIDAAIRRGRLGLADAGEESA